METASRKRPRLTRAQKAGRTRQAILDAAMNIVGEMGHSEASIANITRAANVALGTFYMHFESKQALLEELLPWAGRKAHAHMDAAVANARTHFEYESLNFDALMDFQHQHPFYFRLLSESQVSTPAAYQQHIERSIERYRSVLLTAHRNGELPNYEVAELEVLATLLVSMKLLLFTRYYLSKGSAVDMRRVYMAFVSNALFGTTDYESARTLAPHDQVGEISAVSVRNKRSRPTTITAQKSRS